MSPNHSLGGQPRLGCHINIVGDVLVLLTRLWGGEQGKGRQRKKSRLEKGLEAPSAVHAADCIMWSQATARRISVSSPPAHGASFRFISILADNPYKSSMTSYGFARDCFASALVCP